jgi:hypothetical protein
MRKGKERKDEREYANYKREDRGQTNYRREDEDGVKKGKQKF